VLAQLEKALEACRRSRQVEPTVTALKRNLHALRDGLTLLRRMESDLTDQATELLRQAEAVTTHYWPALGAVGASEDVQRATSAVQAHLDTERPWEDTSELVPHLALVKEAYRLRRRSVLEAHSSKVDLAIDRIKRREGFERLDPDQRHQVLRYLQEGGAAGTDENAIAPHLATLETVLHARREAAEAKALAQLDAFLETLGESPTVELSLELGGREIRSEADLERLLDELRRRILHELGAKHRVRLK
jgi:hypothetical protein